MYNRGFRRDDNNSFRSNAGMSRGHNAPSLMSVSPWEGGVVPGSGSSILGSPNIPSLNNSNMLSPQAAVLAQNLSILSNLGLLHSQFQPRQGQGLPSLVNMASNMGRSMGQQSNFRQMNQPMNRAMNSRFQDQRPKYGRQDGRRVEPFNKNRPRTSQSQISQQKLQSYRPLNSKVPPQQAARKPAMQGAAFSPKGRGEGKGKRGNFKKDPKIPDAEVLVIDEDSKKDEGDEPVTKRDWKTEKKSDVEVVDGDEGKAAADAETMEKEPEGEEANGEKSAVKMEVDNPEETTAKDSIENQGQEKGDKFMILDVHKRSTFYNCHVCSKGMWDERSLNNHIRTAAHKRMMAQLEQTYAVKVKQLRMQMRVLEEQNDREKFRGRGKRQDMSTRGHCKMCDLSFNGNIASHRKTTLHLKLKTFLHPNCVPCGKEFPARMEWDLHKLSSAHWKMMAALEKKRKTIFQLGKPESNYAKMVPRFPEGLDSAVVDMAAEAANKGPPSTADEKGENGDLNQRGLRYDPNLPSGLNMLVHGQHCGVCSKFFSKRGDAIEHCKTRSHFDNYLKMKSKVIQVKVEALRVVAEAAKVAAEEEATAAAASAAPAADETATTADNQLPCPDAETTLGADMMPVVCLKRTSAETEEGNWKRRKATKEDDDEDDERDGLNSSEVKDESQQENQLDVMPDATNVEVYNPLEPTPQSPSAPVDMESSLDMLQAVEDAIDNVESEADSQSTVKPVNKARRGRKRK